MKHALVLCLMLVACGKSTEDKAREEAEAEEKARIAREGPSTTAPTPTEAAKPAPVDKPKDAGTPKEPEPEPTTPEQIDKARKTAMIENRDKDVIKYCEMSKLGDKTDPQILLGCTLAACRQKDEERAHAWSRPLGNPGTKKEFLEQAKKICLQSQVGI